MWCLYFLALINIAIVVCRCVVGAPRAAVYVCSFAGESLNAIIICLSLVSSLSVWPWLAAARRKQAAAAFEQWPGQRLRR